MTRRLLNVGILGAAKIAKKYAIRALQASGAVGDIVVASRDPRKGEAVAREFQVKTKDSYEALLADPSIDAVYVPLPVGLHEEWVVRAAHAGKHVLCEKSLAHSLDAATRMIEACHANNVYLLENFVCDYHPQHDAVLSLIHEGAIGEPFTFRGSFGFPGLPADDIRFDRTLGGGSLNDAGAYIAFMSRKLLESEPRSLSCYLEYGVSGVDVKGAAVFEFPGGRFAFADFGFGPAYQNTYSIWGSLGTISVARAYSIPPDFTPSVTLQTERGGKAAVEAVQAPAANQFELIMRDFCGTILDRDDEKRRRTYTRVLNQAKVVEAMRQSSVRKQRVEL